MFARCTSMCAQNSTTSRVGRRCTRRRRFRPHPIRFQRQTPNGMCEFLGFVNARNGRDAQAMVPSMLHIWMHEASVEMRMARPRQTVRLFAISRWDVVGCFSQQAIWVERLHMLVLDTSKRTILQEASEHRTDMVHMQIQDMYYHFHPKRQSCCLSNTRHERGGRITFRRPICHICMCKCIENYSDSRKEGKDDPTPPLSRGHARKLDVATSGKHAGKKLCAVQ